MSRNAKNKSRNTRTNQLRIIGGQWRGRKLLFPDSEGLRPTSDRVRETLFNWLAPVIQESNCLDLFSGSGALGLEALSRGAAATTLIDTSPKVCAQLRGNLEQLDCSKAKVLTEDAIAWLSKGVSDEKPFDLVFIDPPFNRDLVQTCCQLLEAQDFLEEGAYIYIETELGLQFEVPDNWQLHREKKAGQVAYYLYLKLA